MHIEPYLGLIPEIEERIALLKPDALIVGLGPTAYLMPWVNQGLLSNTRRFGVNDVFRIMPVDDLIILDQPIGCLHPSTDRFQHIVDSRPKRWWIYPQAWHDEVEEARYGWPFWHRQLPECVRSAVQVHQWRAFVPGEFPMKTDSEGRMVPDKYGFELVSDPPQTTCMSPVGATTLAWKLGHRRIGVIGVDATTGGHPSRDPALLGMVNMFMRCISRQAQAQGGLICNLSPISQVSKLPAPSASLLAQTSGSEPPALSES